ncbi:MAG: hypothetical protein JRN59_08470 [Nitrososphaerota archaeon]|nr:hypothetical protein [Nitrososphaerota archaeon]
MSRHPSGCWETGILEPLDGVDDFDGEATDYYLGTTFVRLVRVGKLVHLMFSSR